MHRHPWVWSPKQMVVGRKDEEVVGKVEWCAAMRKQVLDESVESKDIN
jgi:hypothetical protein